MGFRNYMIFIMPVKEFGMSDTWNRIFEIPYFWLVFKIYEFHGIRKK